MGHQLIITQIDKDHLKSRSGLVKDFPKLEIIDGDNWPGNLTIQNFKEFRKQKDSVIFVTEYFKEIVAFTLLELFDKKLRLVYIAVTPPLRRKKIGSYIINHLICTFLVKNRTAIFAEVDEYSEESQKFLQYCGFRANKVLHKFYGENNDAYLMSYIKNV